jgi:flagellar basal body-associated protein FliL
MALSHNAIIVLIIIGCAVSTLLGYSIYLLFFGKEEVTKGPSDDQVAYMRSVRWRNLEMLQAEARETRRGRYEHKDSVQ